MSQNLSAGLPTQDSMQITIVLWLHTTGRNATSVSEHRCGVTLWCVVCSEWCRGSIIQRSGAAEQGAAAVVGCAAVSEFG